jgi:hypothetical protein
MQVSFVADEAFYRDGFLTFRGVRVDFTPSEMPHVDLLVQPTPELPPPVISQIEEVLVPVVEHVQVLDEDVPDDTTYEEDYDDGEVAPMDLSD